jgi:hypothetical protein
MRILARFLVAIGAVVLAACAAGGRTQIAPPVALVSPSMDFAKIKGVGIFPLFPAGLEDQQLSESLISSFQGEVQGRQSQWKIVPYREMLQFVNSGNLGTGYKNLQADYNTYGAPGGQLVLTAQTKQFLKDLQKMAGTDAFLIGTYAVGQPEPVRVLGGTMIRLRPSVTVRMSLYYAPAERPWWTASVKRVGDFDRIAIDIAQSLAANLGKGTLAQL